MKIPQDRIALTQQLHALCVDYWHDVDTNWGRNAPDYYTEDGVFVGPAASYAGREKIRAFYKWREDRGARTVVHSVVNFQARLDEPGKANRISGDAKARCVERLSDECASEDLVRDGRSPSHVHEIAGRHVLRSRFGDEEPNAIGGIKRSHVENAVMLRLPAERREKEVAAIGQELRPYVSGLSSDLVEGRHRHRRSSCCGNQVKATSTTRCEHEDDRTFAVPGCRVRAWSIDQGLRKAALRIDLPQRPARGKKPDGPAVG